MTQLTFGNYVSARRPVEIKKTGHSRRFVFLILGLVILVGPFVYWVDHSTFFHIKGYEVDSLSYLNSNVLWSMLKPYEKAPMKDEVIDEIRNKLEQSGYFEEVGIHITWNMKLALNLKESEVVGTVLNDKLQYINRKGKLIDSDDCKNPPLVPEFEGVEIRTDQIARVRCFSEATHILDYIDENFPELFKSIAKVYVQSDDCPYFLLRNRKLLMMSLTTVRNNLDRFALLFPELYNQQDCDLIDLRYDNQIITKKYN